MIGKRTRFDFEMDEPFWCAEQEKEKEKKKDDKFSSHQEEGKDKLVFCDYDHIYYYDNVNKKSALEFIKLLRQTDEKLQVKKFRGDITEPIIHIHLNSPGGSLLQGFAMASAVKACKSKTIGYAEGMVASAITLPWVVCDVRKIQKYCYCLIHQLSSWFCGSYENFKDNKENLDRFMDQIVKLYLEHTKVPESEIRDILKHDIFWDAEKCMELKLADSTC